MKKRAISTCIAAIVLFSYILFGYINEPISPDQSQPQPTPTPEASASGALARVSRVVDGDTIQLETGERVRYIGVDTPESVDPRRPVECLGKEASEKNKEFVKGQEVRLEKDVSDKDGYGRLLRYVWVGNTMINELLVRQGFAQVATYPPDVKYQERFLLAEQMAREEKIGLWADECNPTMLPASR